MTPRHLLPLVVLACATASLPALAASREATLEGSNLTIDSPCARHVDVRPDPQLHGQAVVSATADHPEELDRLVAETHDGVRVHTVPAGCWQTRLFGGTEPTLTLSIRVPAGFPLAIDESGAGDYSVGDLGGSLRLDLSGAVRVIAADVSSLDLDLSGKSDVDIGQVHGAAKTELSGAGHLAIRRADVPDFSVSISGAANVSVAAGQIDHLRAEDSGFGSIRLDTTVGDADIDMSGVGSIRLAKVTGRVRKDVSGVGTVSIGQ